MIAIASAVTGAEQAKLAELAADLVVLELGADRGGSTVAMAKTARRVHSVDWHRGDVNTGEDDSLYEFFANLEIHGVRDKVVAHIGRFEDVLPILERHSFDGIFIDGCHERASVIADTALALPLVIPGGWLAFHDYGDVYEGVREVVDRLADEHDIEIEVIQTLAVIHL